MMQEYKKRLHRKGYLYVKETKENGVAGIRKSNKDAIVCTNISLNECTIDSRHPSLRDAIIHLDNNVK